MLGGTGDVVLHRHRHVGDVAAAGLGDLGDGLGEAQQPGTGQLVDLAGVAGRRAPPRRRRRCRRRRANGSSWSSSAGRPPRRPGSSRAAACGRSHHQDSATTAPKVDRLPLAAAALPLQHHQLLALIASSAMSGRPPACRDATDSVGGNGRCRPPARPACTGAPGGVVGPVERRLARTRADPHGEDRRSPSRATTRATRLARAAEHRVGRSLSEISVMVDPL